MIGSRKRPKTNLQSCLRGDSNPDLSKQSGSTPLSGRFNPPVETSVLNPLTKEAYRSTMLLIYHLQSSIIFIFQKLKAINSFLYKDLTFGQMSFSLTFSPWSVINFRIIESFLLMSYSIIFLLKKDETCNISLIFNTQALFDCMEIWYITSIPSRD